MDSDVPYSDNVATETLPQHKPARSVPWQIWVVVALLGAEGLGNLVSIPDNPVAAWWLAWKVLFIAGLIKGWKVVYVLAMLFAAIHVIYFLGVPFVAFLNLVLIILMGSALRYYFPKDT